MCRPYVVASFPDLPSNPLTWVDLRKFFVYMWFWMCTLTINEGLQIAVRKPSLNSHLYSSHWISSLDSWSTEHQSSPYVSSSRVLCIVRTVFNWLNFKFGVMINCTSVFALCIVIARFLHCSNHVRTLITSSTSSGFCASAALRLRTLNSC